MEGVLVILEMLLFLPLPVTDGNVSCTTRQLSVKKDIWCTCSGIRKEEHLADPVLVKTVGRAPERHQSMTGPILDTTL